MLTAGSSDTQTKMKDLDDMLTSVTHNKMKELEENQILQYNFKLILGISENETISSAFRSLS